MSKQPRKVGPNPNPTPAQRDEKVSLYGANPEEALAALLKVDPNSDDAEPAEEET